MKILVLMCAVFLKFSFTTSDSNRVSENYTLIHATNLAKHGCESRCGDLIVPYPFGIGNTTNCSINHEFDIYCNTSLKPPKAFLSENNYPSIKQISDSTLRTSNMLSEVCYFPNGTISDSFNISGDLSNTPYTFSQVNMFIVIGCADYAWMASATKSRNYSTGCMVTCSEPEDAVADQCAGSGCCQSSIPKDMMAYVTLLGTLVNSTNLNHTRSFNPCTYAFLGEENEFQFNGAADLNDTSFKENTEANVPIVLEWAIGNLSCPEAQETASFACQSNSTCVNSTRETSGYRCICNEGYEGNPYLSPGCQDIDECMYPERFPCYGTCLNTPGNYTCKCKRGYSGDGKKHDGCRRKPFNTLLFSLGMGLGILALLIGSSLWYLMAKKRRILKLREKFYEENGGVLLENKLKTKDGVGANSMKIFGVQELEEATNNYAEDMILGRGGNGVVYKGILRNKRVVAIKKSQRLDKTQREQFINEIVILTQISHINVVQLLGCCLEDDVPLLVYEFVPNKTLYFHIHNTKYGIRRLSWENRLKIAHESASALSYLHTDARMSIIHRDVKSANILLDDNYTAKIADFGASRLVPLGHDQVTTLVQGTFGYLDPEYFHTGQLTDKSDVYSFGVVLAELLTGKKPVSAERGLEDRNLATYFVKAIKENQFLEIIDRQVVDEATYEQLKAICSLVCSCLKQVGVNRPSMKEVITELETLRNLKKHPWDNQREYNETSSLMIEHEEIGHYAIPLEGDSYTFGEQSFNISTCSTSSRIASE